MSPIVTIPMEALQRGLHWLDKTPKALVYLLAAIGSVPALTYVGSSLLRVWKYFGRKEVNLPARYGQNSYVLITGASDGIGKSLAFEFAKRGFNLVIIARRAQVLEDMKVELEQRYSITVKTLAYDLSLGADPTHLNKHVIQPLADLDVSILVNNAAIITNNWFLDTSPSDLQALLSLNVLALTYLTHFSLPKLSLRPNPSAVININSFSGLYPLPFAATYSASKSYLRALTFGLSSELVKVDVMNCIVGLTSTRMTAYRKHLASSDEVARGIVDDLGKRVETDICPAFAKQIQANDRLGWERVITWSKTFYPQFSKSTEAARAKLAASNS